MKYNLLPFTISFGATTFICQKTRRCPKAIISTVHINLFLHIFHQEEVGDGTTNGTGGVGGGVCTSAKCFFFSLRKNVTIFRGSRHCTLVAEQHANTQSFIRKADGSVIWYPSILVMVWVPGFLIHWSRAKMESMNLFDFVFQLFCVPK